jgi:hypothetical protein
MVDIWYPTQFTHSLPTNTNLSLLPTIEQCYWVVMLVYNSCVSSYPSSVHFYHLCLSFTALHTEMAAYYVLSNISLRFIFSRRYWWPVFAFVLLGLDRVANMYYIP